LWLSWLIDGFGLETEQTSDESMDGFMVAEPAGIWLTDMYLWWIWL
jgi:hypothetical protein